MSFIRSYNIGLIDTNYINIQEYQSDTPLLSFNGKQLKLRGSRDTISHPEIIEKIIKLFIDTQEQTYSLINLEKEIGLVRTDLNEKNAMIKKFFWEINDKLINPNTINQYLFENKKKLSSLLENQKVLKSTLNEALNSYHQYSNKVGIRCFTIEEAEYAENLIKMSPYQFTTPKQ